MAKKKNSNPNDGVKRQKAYMIRDMPVDHKNIISDIARDQDRKVSDVLCDAIDLYLEHLEKQKSNKKAA